MDPLNKKDSNATIGDDDDFEADVLQVESTMDLYAVLNVDTQAGDEDIKNAYKRLCMAFHPDKYLNPEEKEMAAKRFQAVQRAYEVLSDPTKRYLYEMYGEEACQASGVAEWTVGQRFKSKEEIRAEFERRERIKREMDAQNLVKSRGELSIELDACEAVAKWKDVLRFGQRRKPVLVVGLESRHDALPSIAHSLIDGFRLPDLSSASVSHGFEMKVSDDATRLDLSGTVSARSGIGSGNVNVTLRKAFSDSLSAEGTIVIQEQPHAIVRASKQFDDDVWGTAVVQASGLRTMPIPTFTVQRRFTTTSIGFLAYRPDLRRFVPESQFHDVSLCSLGFVRKANKREWTAEVKAGVSQSHIVLSRTQTIIGRLRARFDVSLSTDAEVETSVFCEKRIDKNTRFSIGVSCGHTRGVFVRLRLKRLNQKLTLPILISPQVDLVLAVAAFSVPFVAFLGVEQFILHPWRQKQRKSAIEWIKKENADLMESRRLDAIHEIDLMREMVARRVEQEEAKDGLVILEALYGTDLPPSQLATVRVLSPQGIQDMVKTIRNQLSSVMVVSIQTGSTGSFDPPQALDKTDPSKPYIDVTIPVQSLVLNGQLHIGGGYSKSSMIGFFDPAFGEKKRLRITYQFQKRIHQVEVDDKASVAAPLRGNV